MSETIDPKPEQAKPAPNQVGLTAGAMLRQAREAAGLHVAALAVSMKVPVKKLEALEADRLDLLPDTVFVRALASSMCRALKVDPAAVLEKLPHGHAPRLVPDESRINTPFQPHGPNFGHSLSGYFAKPVPIVVVVLLLLALAIFLYPQSVTPDTASQTGAGAADTTATASGSSGGPMASDGVQAPPPTVTTTPVPLVSPAPPSVAATSSAAQPAARASSPEGPAKLPDAKPVVVEPKPVPAAAVQVSGASVASPALLSFKTKGESWVQATDANGQVLLNRTLIAGESVAVQGATPISVVIGRVDSTQVEVRGSPFNLGAITKDNVARFEVK